MNDQCESPTIEEIQADFIRAVREGDRVTVSKVNAIGGWDSSHFSTRDIRVAADELDRLRVENERLRAALEKIASYLPMFDYTFSSRRGRIDEHMPGSPFDRGRAQEANHLSSIARPALQADGGTNDQT